MSTKAQSAALITAAAAFTALSILVSHGQLDRVDSYAVRNLMPFTGAHHGGTTTLERLLAYKGTRFHAGRVLRLPASVLVATILMLVASLVLWRRGRRRWALLWFVAFVLVGVVELACKLTITKPALYTISNGVLDPIGLRSSFPSGHALRAALLVTVFASLWPLLTPVLLLWFAGVVVTLELDGVHTPSDIVGGLLLACVATLTVALLASDSSRTTRRPDR